ncbi:NAD(P)-dependent oxidoreductase [Meridianimarinicoccus roseus]|uniref:NAD(P)-dependent oxidoreductase n=1 Tax=Meridianimarinicoccus roseus TaxID=2072018 RepID=A0A2V2LBH4_9RHOB|nr:SDR family oxidoreductase [Meridianimarinicoccus roseus]PWR01061.1 NAD(P)-dependent oxidoreductase [Meridianimarinicoccus roseus]PWR02137.1 NAD(P)-dependent oxidoreductase [Meridianimarinicoccus roseus]PWR03665.1 NAD(P)-dependent oxidoreductase [Meridianimarinicoccus roseus]PWR04261.1 NAD(P)-dependent oxidoreductase [Meridianimarinicoccus roseus]
MNVLVAGATGHLGRYLCAEYARRGHHVTALVRDTARGEGLADLTVEAEATRPETLTGIMDGMDLVVSSLGITRQTDGLGYRDVDFQANLNLLREAEAARVKRFAYIHVLHAEDMPGVPLIDAKAAFVDALRACDMPATVIAPTGFFSDMAEILDMARRGRVWLFGDGTQRLNPIHGADLAMAVADATEAGRGWAEVGGPDVMTQGEIARAAFAALGTAPRITHLPDALRRAALTVLPILPRRVSGPARFFLTALGMDMIAPRFGTRRLAEYFETLAADETRQPKQNQS